MRPMKDSGIPWIGMIPKSWEPFPIKHCADLDKEKLSEKTDYEYEFQYIDIGSVTEYGGIGETSEMCFGKSPSRARMVVHDGDTIVSTVRTYLKAVAYIDKLKDHVCSTGFCVISPREKVLYPKFAYYMLQSEYVVQKIVSESVGVSYPAISSTEIGNIKIPLPELVDQERITKYLDQKCEIIDSLIRTREKQNALLKERRQSLIYEAVTKGLDPTVPMKDSGIKWIGTIPQNWTTLRVKHLATEKGSLFLDGDWINSDVIIDEGVRYLTSGNVGEGAFKEQGKGYISQETFDAMGCLKALPGDLMISRLNEPVGRCCLIPSEEQFYVVAVDNVILRPNKAYNKRYIMYCMNTSEYARSALMAASGTTMQRISRTALGNLCIPMPEKRVQEQIVEFLDTKCGAIDAYIQQNEQAIQKLKEYRQSLIYEAVTGKIEV